MERVDVQVGLVEAVEKDETVGACVYGFDLASVDLTWEGQAWAVKALAVLVLGVLLAGAGAAGLWLLRPRETTTTQEARA